MKITKEQRKQILEINEMVKSLDPILKKRVIDIELREIFGDDYLNILSATEKNDIVQKPDSELPNPVALSVLEGKDDSPPTVKAFFDEKSPANSVETVTVFGWYLEHYEKMDEFSERDISRAYYEARARKPKVIGQSLRDARNIKGYLVEGSKKGRFRLSNIGENLVLHDLPWKSCK